MIEYLKSFARLGDTDTKNMTLEGLIKGDIEHNYESQEVRFALKPHARDEYNDVPLDQEIAVMYTGDIALEHMQSLREAKQNQTKIILQGSYFAKTSDEPRRFEPYAIVFTLCP